MEERESREERGGGTRTLKQAAHRHRSSRSSILIHIFSSCLFSNLSLSSPPPPPVSVLQAAKMLALPPPFVLQWERECTADALLSAAQPASEQCIGLMQCSCVLTHSTSPPPVCLLLPPLTVTIFSSLLRALSLPCSVPHLSLLSLSRSLHLCRSPSVCLLRLHTTFPCLSLKLRAYHFNVSYRDKSSDSLLQLQSGFAFSVSLVRTAVRLCFQWRCGLLLLLTL